jgi:RING-variant domain
MSTKVMRVTAESAFNTLTDSFDYQFRGSKHRHQLRHTHPPNHHRAKMSKAYYFSYGSATMDDLKAPAAPPASDGNNDNDASKGPINLQPPSYQRVNRPAGAAEDGSSIAEEKTCRICLEDDEQETMIAPCRCKGGSKWVHRDCLDEWRTNEKDRAFSKCTECLFEYYMELHDRRGDENLHRRRRIRFCLNVSRDVCFGTVLLQMAIFALAALIYACDVNKALPELLAFQRHPLSLYYLMGWLLLLVLIGLYGSVALCVNGCSVSQSIAQLGPPYGPTTPSSTAPFNAVSVQSDLARGIGAESTTEYYRRARQRRQRHFRGGNGRCNNDNCCYYGCYDCHPCLCVDMCNTCGDCCDCCCEGRGGGHTSHINGGDCSHGCCCGEGGSSGASGSGNGNGGDCGDGAHILLLILLIAAVVLALIGFFVGIVITVIAFQRVIQRHVYLLQKRQLVQEFRVMDLQGYNLDVPVATAPPHEEDVEVAGATATAPALPSASAMADVDAAYLHKLGLMDAR